MIKINCDRELLSHVLYVSITVVGNGLKVLKLLWLRLVARCGTPNRAPLTQSKTVGAFKLSRCCLVIVTAKEGKNDERAIPLLHDTTDFVSA